MKLPVSLVVVALNEERNIERCLRSVNFASEIIVVDTGSNDKTCEIAEKLGAKVIKTDWKGFGPTKAWATNQAQNDWVLSLDADEELSTDLQNEIQEKFKELDPKVGYQFPRLSLYLGRWIKHGGWHPDFQLRLFHRQFANWNQALIHEKVEIENTKKFTKNIQHYVFIDKANQVATNNRYSSLQAEQAFKNGVRFSFWKMITKPETKFYECYFLKLGFLDGLPGLFIAWSASYSVFLKWVKIWELEKGLHK